MRRKGITSIKAFKTHKNVRIMVPFTANPTYIRKGKNNLNSGSAMIYPKAFHINKHPISFVTKAIVHTESEFIF